MRKKRQSINNNDTTTNTTTNNKRKKRIIRKRTRNESLVQDIPTEKLYCVCRQPNDPSRAYIGCEGGCDEWFHPECIGMPLNAIPDHWQCNSCIEKRNGRRNNQDLIRKSNIRQEKKRGNKKLAQRSFMFSMEEFGGDEDDLWLSSTDENDDECDTDNDLYNNNNNEKEKNKKVGYLYFEQLVKSFANEDFGIDLYKNLPIESRDRALIRHMLKKKLLLQNELINIDLRVRALRDALDMTMIISTRRKVGTSKIKNLENLYGNWMIPYSWSHYYKPLDIRTRRVRTQYIITEKNKNKLKHDKNIENIHRFERIWADMFLCPGCYGSIPYHQYINHVESCVNEFKKNNLNNNLNYNNRSNEILNINDPNNLIVCGYPSDKLKTDICLISRDKCMKHLGWDIKRKLKLIQDEFILSRRIELLNDEINNVQLRIKYREEDLIISKERSKQMPALNPSTFNVDIHNQQMIATAAAYNTATQDIYNTNTSTVFNTDMVMAQMSPIQAQMFMNVMQNGAGIPPTTNLLPPSQQQTQQQQYQSLLQQQQQLLQQQQLQQQRI